MSSDWWWGFMLGCVAVVFVRLILDVYRNDRNGR